MEEREDKRSGQPCKVLGSNCESEAYTNNKISRHLGLSMDDHFGPSETVKCCDIFAGARRQTTNKIRPPLLCWSVLAPAQPPPGGGLQTTSTGLWPHPIGTPFLKQRHARWPRRECPPARPKTRPRISRERRLPAKRARATPRSTNMGGARARRCLAPSGAYKAQVPYVGGGPVGGRCPTGGSGPADKLT